MDSLLEILQFADGLFPLGGHAHSFGLEAAVASGEVRDAAGLREFVVAYLQGSCGPLDAATLLATLRLARAGGAEEDVVNLDRDLDAAKPAAESRAASRQMGAQLLRHAAALTGEARLISYQKRVGEQRAPGHHGVVFGLLAAALDWAEEAAARAFLYSAASGLAVAALRLLPLGQTAGQHLLWELGPEIAMRAEEARTAAEPWSFAPLAEIAALRHAELEARLFRS